MIDPTRLRDDPEGLAEAFRRRGETVDVPALAEAEAAVRKLKHAAESKRAEAKRVSKAVGTAIKEGADPAAAKEEARSLSEAAKQFDRERQAREDELHERLLSLPNPCLPAVPVGAGEEDNVVVATSGAPPTFDFEPRPHWELAADLDIIDFERGAKLTGSAFVAYRGAGARLQRALINWYLDRHRAEGYEELLTPFLVNPRTMQGTGQLPKFADQLYHCERDDLYLVPTAEVTLTNYHAGEILEAADLPRRYCGYTPCFRSEAGAAGVGTRGITRIHQFDKVEMVWLTVPGDSAAALETMRGHAEALLRELGLTWRVLDICTGDIGFAAARTYDLEVWAPGVGDWLEVSSCSDCADFQARRAGIRYRPEPGAKPRLVHTLNGSGLALPRSLIAVLETHQRADGGVVVPEVLRPYLDGLERIGP